MDVYIEIETDIFWIKTIEREKEMSSATLAVIWKCNFIEWLEIDREWTELVNFKLTNQTKSEK